jgi:hypothetical protein
MGGVLVDYGFIAASSKPSRQTRGARMHRLQSMKTSLSRKLNFAATIFLVALPRVLQSRLEQHHGLAGIALSDASRPLRFYAVLRTGLPNPDPADLGHHL